MYDYSVVVFVFGIIFSIGVYVWVALCLHIIANKTNTPNAWLAWIPIANIYLMCKVTGRSGSADIVASTQRGDPMLVSCTMAMPDARKRNMLLAAQTAIVNRSGMPLEAIRVVLVTGKPSVSPSDTGLLELAATDLERLWVMCRQGNLSEARRLLRCQ